MLLKGFKNVTNLSKNILAFMSTEANLKPQANRQPK